MPITHEEAPIATITSLLRILSEIDYQFFFFQTDNVIDRYSTTYVYTYDLGNKEAHYMFQEERIYIITIPGQDVTVSSLSPGQDVSNTSTYQG